MMKIKGVKMQYKKAFTMAEAILVMTILGIIATIMITSLKPAQFKDKGFSIMANKVLSEIDTSVTQILVNDSKYGKLDNLLDENVMFSFSAADKAANLENLFKKYLTATRKDVTGTYCATDTTFSFALKDGACMGVKMGKVDAAATIFPGEDTTTSVTAEYGVIKFDINSEEEPNVLGKDQFLLPIAAEGIEY